MATWSCLAWLCATFVSLSTSRLNFSQLNWFLKISFVSDFRNKPSQGMTLPHPESGKDKYGNRDIPHHGSIVWKFFKRTVNITGYRNGKDDMNPAKNRTFGGILHDWSFKSICRRLSIRINASYRLSVTTRPLARQ